MKTNKTNDKNLLVIIPSFNWAGAITVLGNALGILIATDKPWLRNIAEFFGFRDKYASFDDTYSSEIWGKESKEERIKNLGATEVSEYQASRMMFFLETIERVSKEKGTALRFGKYKSGFAIGNDPAIEPLTEKEITAQAFKSHTKKRIKAGLLPN